MEGRLSEVIGCANYIPSGRQLPRTPPMTSVKRHLDFGNSDEEPVMPNSNAEADRDVGVLGGSSLKMENPYYMLKGMKGYRLIPEDLKFIKKKAEEELVRKLQGELAETRGMLKKEVNALELALASREVILASFNQFPSSDELSNWAKLVLGENSDLDTQSLWAMVTMEKIQRFTDQKKKAIAKTEETAAEKCKKEAEDRGHLKRQVADEEMKIQELMKQLMDLKSDLFQQEKNKCKELKENSEELQVTKGKGRRKENQRKDVKSDEPVEEIASKSRPKRTNKEMSVKQGQSVKETSKQKSGEPLKPLNVTRVRRQKTEPLESQQPVPELRRSKRIASRR